MFPLVALWASPPVWAVELDRSTLVRDVLDGSPSIRAAEAALDAGRARAELAVWSDPEIAYEMAPLSLGQERFGQTVALSQALPAPGTLRVRAERLQAEARVVETDLDALRRALALEASMAYDELFRADQELAVLEMHKRLLRELKAAAEAAYGTGRGEFADPLMAEMELAHVEHEGLLLEGERDAVRTRINGLLHRSPDADLGAPPNTLPEPVIPVDAEPRSAAVDAAQHRVDAARAWVAATRRERWPMVMAMASWSTMWEMPEHRLMLGATVALPLWGRDAMVREASAMVAEAQHDREAMADEAAVEAARARIALQQALHVVHHYDERLLPTARAQVAAVRAGFVAGRTDFDAVIGAERTLRDLELQRVDALATAWTERARLTLATGGTPGLEESTP